MSDPYLYNLLHGINTPKSFLTAPPDRFELAFKASIRKEVDKEMTEEDPMAHQLLPLTVRRAKKEREELDSWNMTELEDLLSEAFMIIRVKEANDLSDKEYLRLLQEVDALSNRIETTALSDIGQIDLKMILHMHDDSLALLLRVAIHKFKLEQYRQSLALFALLSSLDSEEPDYWYRLGLVAQRSGLLDLALRAYATTSKLAPDFIGGFFFSAQCLLKLNLQEEARLQLMSAKQIFQLLPEKEEWGERLVEMESLLS